MTVAATTFAESIAQKFPHIVIMSLYVDYRDQDERIMETYGNLPARPAASERIEGVEAVAQWINDNLFQYACDDESIQDWQKQLLQVEAGNLQAFCNELQSLTNEVAEWGHYKIETEQQNKSRLATHRLKSMEPLAISIAERYKVEVGTVEFVTALHKEVARQTEREQDRRTGLMEDGLCIGMGVSYSQWQEEFDSPLYAYVEAREVLIWLKEFCPLLYTLWQQQYPEGLTLEQVWED